MKYQKVICFFFLLLFLLFPVSCGMKEEPPAKSAAVSAILAGNDLLCVTDYQTQIPAVVEAVRNGVIPEEAIDGALYRVLSLKKDLGLI